MMSRCVSMRQWIAVHERGNWSIVDGLGDQQGLVMRVFVGVVMVIVMNVMIMVVVAVVSLDVAAGRVGAGGDSKGDGEEELKVQLQLSEILSGCTRLTVIGFILACVA